jgi:hypothetical protein
MRSKWTRRKFLRTSLGSSLVAGAGAALSGGSAALAAGLKSQPAQTGLTSAQRAILRAAMDEIIPAVGDMPAASVVGGADYVDRVARENPGLRKIIAQSLASLESLSKKRIGKTFAALPSSQRIETLQAFEKQSAESFITLRDFTYEAYYTEPRVWKLIGYELHPTNESGPRMKPFDESVLAQVKKMPKRYREVS